MKYTIITIGSENRRAKVEKIRSTLAGYLEEVFIECVDGRDSEQLQRNIDRHGYDIHLPFWKPGEAGIWYSTINAWNYSANNNVDLLVFEDDAELRTNFLSHLSKIDTNGLDVISLYAPYGRVKNRPFTLVKNYQEYSNAAIIYTSEGSKKALKLLSAGGLVYPVDIWLFKYVNSGLLKGVCPSENSVPIVDVDWNAESNIQNQEKVEVR